MLRARTQRATPPKASRRGKGQSSAKGALGSCPCCCLPKVELPLPKEAPRIPASFSVLKFLVAFAKEKADHGDTEAQSILAVEQRKAKTGRAIARIRALLILLWSRIGEGGYPPLYRRLLQNGIRVGDPAEETWVQLLTVPKTGYAFFLPPEVA
eukprot:4644177-Amphidinium_carterae.1